MEFNSEISEVVYSDAEFVSIQVFPDWRRVIHRSVFLTPETEVLLVCAAEIAFDKIEWNAKNDHE